MPGHITINNVKKELMPVEMKAEMLSLLGYPEDFLSKNKNYIFRYTVYTPQEEMKLILHEDAEIRLDGLRKIFNIDRYKNIRENVQVYLKKMRSDVAALNAKIEPLQEYKLQRQQLLLELEKTERSVQELLPLKQEIREKIPAAETGAGRTGIAAERICLCAAGIKNGFAARRRTAEKIAAAGT